MFRSLYNLTGLLAQASPDDLDDKPAAPPEASHPLSFSDLQRGLRSASHADPSDQHFKFALIIMIAIVLLIGIFLHLRQRRKNPLPPNSPRKLAWELAKKIRLPLDTRLFLAWTAHSAHLPMAHLMISPTAFDRSLSHWSPQPTLTRLRRRGTSRLPKSRPPPLHPRNHSSPSTAMAMRWCPYRTE